MRTLGLHNNLRMKVWYPRFTDEETSKRQSQLLIVTLLICTQSWGFQPSFV